MEWIEIGAFYDSDELYDIPKCVPHTHVVVLDEIMQWIANSESARNEFKLWLFGPAGAGKSTIIKRIAQIAADKDPSAHFSSPEHETLLRSVIPIPDSLPTLTNSRREIVRTVYISYHSCQICRVEPSSTVNIILVDKIPCYSS